MDKFVPFVNVPGEMILKHAISTGVPASDYSDVVSQEDIDGLHAHVEQEFGPAEECAIAYGPAW